MSKTTEMATVRRLGLLEAGSAAFHLMGLYRAVVVSATYSIPSDKPSKEAIYAALGEVITENPILRVGIKDEGETKAYFTHIPEMKLDNFVEFRSSVPEKFTKNLEELHCWCHDQIFQDVETRPPWRMVVLRPAGEAPEFEAIVFAFHHSLMDGMGGRLFHEKLLAKLNTLPPNPSWSSTLSFPELPVLPEPQDKVIDYTTTIPHRLMGWCSWMWPSFLSRATPEIWSAEPIDFSRPHKTRIVTANIPPNVVKSVLEDTRSHGTSLTGLLHAVALTSLSRRVPDALGFVSSTPISMRPYLSPTADPALKEALFGCVSGTSHEHQLTAIKALRRAQGDALDDLVWSHAQKIKDELKQKTSTLPANDGLQALRGIKDWTEFLTDRDHQKRTKTWEVSNIGQLTQVSESGDEEESDVEKRTITHAMFTNSPMISSDPMSISVISVKGGGLTLGITWNEGIVDEELMEALGDDLESAMKQLHEEGGLRMDWLYDDDD
ncbi:uncharacterized protein FIESC28_01712 [Fusarium coffeatum]|uniref:Alcohol acetyltransferase FCK4 n=1 Tax=Fusarium coffeatum TaxID=231269 RepID=A0A366S838_9HYPO|nr:uncharacterized protein FIESC28_01712 [Fusarium coffeatum]RBR25474.1 hypothetical protein FIESC28_01712 [Fusarium coffeatum]